MIKASFHSFFHFVESIVVQSSSLWRLFAFTLVVQLSINAIHLPGAEGLAWVHDLYHVQYHLHHRNRSSHCSSTAASQVRQPWHQNQSRGYNFIRSLKSHPKTSFGVVKKHVEVEDERSRRKMSDHGLYETETNGPVRINSRRRFLFESVSSGIVSSTFVMLPLQVLYASAAETSIVSTSKTEILKITPDEAKITHKVFFNVRISRKDGTFYVRDDIITNKDDPLYEEDNEVYIGRLVIELFGKNAPTHVERFLSYIGVPTMSESPFDDNPYPSYSRSLFTKFNQATGVITAGCIPSLEVKEMNGSNVLKYGGRLFPAKLWLEKGATTKITHIGKGLLTHTLLDPTPEFGITTRTDTSVLDSSNVVFGRILLDNSSNEFLARLSKIPTYALERPVPTDEGLVDEAAELIFNAQREFFRNAAKSIGDTRVSKVYEGKFLRRIEVTQVGLLNQP